MGPMGPTRPGALAQLGFLSAKSGPIIIKAVINRAKNGARYKTVKISWPHFWPHN